MCGIAGFYSKNNLLGEADLDTMSAKLLHRGPDAHGNYHDGQIGLTHRRLSILDLTEDANQPMFSSDGRYVIVYNGEVYNFREIAQTLNIHTKTRSDTEVILEAFAVEGVKFVERLNGMFAMAIYDRHEAKLWLFRDRLGIKPLFYFWQQGLLVFGSELKSMISVLKTKNLLNIHKNAIASYLYLGYVPEPNTIYEEIKKFPAGAYATLSNNNLEIKEYWKAKDFVSDKIESDRLKAKDTLKDLLRSAVAFRMISDVSLGTFLSGGIDSSLVTAIAQELSGQPVQTFSIGFKESRFNESTWAKKVAKHLGTDHHEFILTYGDALDQLENFLNIYDEPFVDSSGIPMLLISKMAKQKVTVTLSGDGGDELFLGYGMYSWAKRLSHPAIKHFHKTLARVINKIPQNKYKRAACVIDYLHEAKLKSHIFSQEQYLFSEKEIDKLLLFDFSGFDDDEQYNHIARKLDSKESQALFDINHYLKDDLLVKVDRASMFHSLENRVPLLDHRIVEFALNLDVSLKYQNGISKYLLKQVLYDYLPSDLFDRPKWGFAIPLVEWLKTEMKYLMDQYLSKACVEHHGVVEYKFVNKLKIDFFKGKNYLYNRLWSLILLHKWLSEHH